MLTSLYVRLIGAAVLVAALIFGWHELTSHYDRQGYTRAKAEDTAAADQQAARNRELQRQAETKYVVQQATRDRFIVTTVKEIRHDTENLAACKLSDAAVDRLRHAAECVSGEDRPASCGAGEQVR